MSIQALRPALVFFSALFLLSFFTRPFMDSNLRVELLSFPIRLDWFVGFHVYAFAVLVTYLDALRRRRTR